jgi:hypothetical protein
MTLPLSPMLAAVRTGETKAGRCHIMLRFWSGGLVMSFVVALSRSMRRDINTDHVSPCCRLTLVEEPRPWFLHVIPQ